MARDPFGLGKIDLGFGPKKKRTLGVRDKHIVYRRAKGRCEGCGKKIEEGEMQVGHKKAYAKGGATTSANSVCLCYRCNKDQGTDSFDAFKKKMNGTYGKRSTKKASAKKKTTKRKRSTNPFDFRIRI